MCPKFLVTTQNIDSRIIENVVNLVGLKEVVDGYCHRTRFQYTEKGPNEFRTVFQPDPNPVSWLNPELVTQVVRNARRLLPQLCIAVFALTPKQRGFGGAFLNGGGEGTSEIHQAYPMKKIRLCARTRWASRSLRTIRRGVNGGKNRALWLIEPMPLQPI